MRRLIMAFGEWCYRRLLRLYPRDFRDEFGREMSRLYRDRAQAESGLRLWLEVLGDVVRTAPREHLHLLLQDVRHALRLLPRTPVVTTAAILTLALGVGANTAVFSVVYAVVLRPLPYPEPDRLIELFESNQSRNLLAFRVSALNYRSWAERTTSFDALAAFQGATLNLTDGGDPERVTGGTITASLFRVLGIPPLAGRALTAQDERPGADPVVLISESLWRRRFGGDPSIVGQSITLNGARHEVVGIVPRTFREVGRTQITAAGDPQIFVPLVIDPAREQRGNHVLRVVGRLAPGVSIARARDEMQAIGAALAQEFPDSNRDWGVRLDPIANTMFDPRVRPSLYVLLGAVGAVLLIACANVANLLLARGVNRRPELAVRAALGASPGRIVRQLLTESVCLAAVSGACGLAMSLAAVQALRVLLPPTLPRVGEIGIDGAVLTFASIVSIASGLLFGVAPAFRATRVDLLRSLSRSGRGLLDGSGAVLRHGLVVAQMALTTMLLMAAALFLQSFIRLQQAPLGFEPAHVMTARLSLPSPKYADDARVAGFYQRLGDTLRAASDVQAVGFGTSAPFTPGVRAIATLRDPSSASGSPETRTTAGQHIVGSGFFSAVGAPLLAGRPFSQDDRPGGPPVAIVTEALAQQLWPDGAPVGRTIEMNGRAHTVVGVVGDLRGSDGRGLDREPQRAIYLAAEQFPQRSMTIVIRARGEAALVTPRIRESIRQLDPTLPISDVRPLSVWLSESGAQPRLMTTLTSAFAVTALLLAAVGVYGVLAYSVGRRTQEIGVRMAMGATRGEVLRLVLRGGMLWACAGIVLGLIGAVSLSRVLATLLFDMPARDPLTFAGVGLALALVALAACYVPAARATRIDPIIALRGE